MKRTFKDNFLEQKVTKRHLKVCCVYILMTEYIFYKISCIDKNVDYSYIGSTKNFRRRKSQHKSDATIETSNKYNYPLYKTIKENGGWDNWCMVPIGKGIFEKKLDALIEEQKYITDNNSTLNAVRSFNTKEDKDNYKKQYLINNPETRKETQKKYRDTHKEKINEKITCECGRCYTRGNKARHLKSKIHIDYLSKL